MNFKIYDILSSLVPGFLFLIVIFKFFGILYDKDQLVLYTALAFFIGYIINTLSSWLEDVYFYSWLGKPSDCLLDGKDIWKVRFYESKKVKELLKSKTEQSNPTNNELFAIAMRDTNPKDGLIEDLNSSYAFSRSLLTCTLLSGILLSFRYYNDWRFYLVFLIVTLIIWLRCKQRAYYYAREILNCYLKNKVS
ncbi:MAG TPA: hypothetical protein PLD02_03815 [Saprospiraceae bacterium]|nr:hypothetical protein [Saprospiraceae bacterium]